MKKYGLIIIINLVLCFRAYPQQDPLYSMYMLDKMLINPAFTGSSNWAVGTLKYRDNLTGLNNQYSTQTFNFHTPIQTKHMGIGFKVVNEKRFFLNNMNLALSASYHINFAGGKLSFGLEGGIYQRRINYDKLTLIKLGDQAIPQNPVSSTIPDISFGGYYQKKQFYMGYSIYHLMKSDFDKNSYANSGSFLYKSNYVIIGNIFDISKDWALEPSALFKYQQGTTQLDLNMLLCYNDRFSVGLQYRTGSALLSMVKFNITENLKIAYAFDYSLSKFSQLTGGAHEIVISYGIKLPPPPTKKEIHPRYYF